MATISIVTPTYRREALLTAQLQQLHRQTVEDWEWLILDDSPQPSPHFSQARDRRVRYHHHAGAKLTIGAKRNWLVERASSDVIAHFDDDDYYAPGYLAEMAGHIGSGADFAKLSAWFLYSHVYRKLAYWDTTITRGLHFHFSAQALKASLFGDTESRTFAGNHLGYGFSYVYRKAVWERNPFLPQDYDEDREFISAALTSGFKLDHFADQTGLCIHMLRHDNSSSCWPQYVLPNFMLGCFFKHAPISGTAIAPAGV
jgi:glycosyltransferase involved in cell wall biosynthesis